MKRLVIYLVLMILTVFSSSVPGNSDTTSDLSTASIIGVNRSSLRFTATAGGDNPLFQPIHITNIGAGSLNWSASTDVPWLSVGPASGVAPSILTAYVSTPGLLAGTYSGAIMISAAGAANSPVYIPVTLSLGLPGGGDLIMNGSFEGFVSPWSLVDRAITGFQEFPRSGTGNLILCGMDNSGGGAYQRITIPRFSDPIMAFAINVTTTETTTTIQYDRLFVEIYNSSGTLIETLATFSNLDGTAAGNYTLVIVFHMDRFAGQSVIIGFRATNDSILPTIFRVDDVSVRPDRNF
jgi:hypothetical protein